MEDEELGGVVPEKSDVAGVAEALVREDSRWNAGAASAFGSVMWKPDLSRVATKDDEAAVLHIHLADRLRPYVSERMKAAADVATEVHLALPVSSLYDEDLLTNTLNANPVLHVIRDPANTGNPGLSEPLGLLTCLAMNGVRVSSECRRALATEAFDAVLRREGTAFGRGRQFEGLVLFLLSQTWDFTVVERNLRTATEEIDAVIQQRSTSGRAWALERPYILVEGKNWNRPVDQPAVSVFRIKLMSRPAATRIGFLFASDGFTSDGQIQELRFTLDDATIVFVGGEEIRAWIGSYDPDAYLEALVRRALLN